MSGYFQFTGKEDENNTHFSPDMVEKIKADEMSEVRGGIKFVVWLFGVLAVLMVLFSLDDIIYAESFSFSAVGDFVSYLLILIGWAVSGAIYLKKTKDCKNLEDARALMNKNMNEFFSRTSILFLALVAVQFLFTVLRFLETDEKTAFGTGAVIFYAVGFIAFIVAVIFYRKDKIKQAAELQNIDIN
ncbi:MAG: hypothetical protein LBM87_04160 [Ruminococcus sp.]|jgi:hypothetical protein|nr:hypothetical protein [Ruminococcus sp.]